MIKENYHKHKETIHNFFWRSLQIFAKQGITFLIFILTAKLLVPYEFGIYNYVLAIVFFLIIFGDFGISTATSKFVAEYNATDKEKLKLVLFNSGIIILAFTVFVSLIVILFGKFFLGDKYIYVLYTLPLIFLVPMTSLYDGIYRGLKKFKLLSLISVIVGLISLSFVYILIIKFGMIGALLSQNLFYLVLFIVFVFGYKEQKITLNKEILRHIFGYSFLIGISSIGFYLYTRVDILVLGHFGYVEEIGYYEIINRLFIIITLPFLIFAQVIAPNISKFNIKNNIVEIKKRLRILSIILIPTSMIISIILYYIFPLLLKLFLSEYYTNKMILGFYILLYLLPLKIWGIIQSNAFITPTGNAKILTIVTLIGGILNFIFDLILISQLGFLGVFWATLIVHSISIITVTIFYLNKITKKNEIKKNY